VKARIETGRFSYQEEAVREAQVLWEKRERGRLEILAGITRRGRCIARARRGSTHHGRIDEGSRRGFRRARTPIAGGGTHCTAGDELQLAPQAGADLDDIGPASRLRSTSLTA